MNRRAFFAAVPAALVGAKAVLEAKPVAPVLEPIKGSLASVPFTSGYIAPFGELSNGTANSVQTTIVSWGRSGNTNDPLGFSYERMQQGEADIRAGRVVPHKKAFRRLRKRS